jgi:hypothetical protein
MVLVMRAAACFLFLLCAGCTPAFPALPGAGPLFILGWGAPDASGQELTGQASLNGTPWRGARIAVWPLGAGAPLAESTTDDAGRFRTPLNVPGGTPLRVEARQGAERLAAFTVAPGTRGPAAWRLQQLAADVLIDAGTTLALLTLAPRLEALTQVLAQQSGSNAGAALIPLMRAYSEASAAATLTLQALGSDPARQASVVNALTAWDPAAGLSGFSTEVLNTVTAPGTPFAQAIASVARSLDEALTAAGAGAGPVTLPPALLAPLTIGQVTLPAVSLAPSADAPANPTPPTAEGPPVTNAPPAAGGGGAGGGGGSSSGNATSPVPSLQLGPARGVPTRATSTAPGTVWQAQTGTPTRASDTTQTMTPQLLPGVPTRLETDAQAVSLPAPGSMPAPAPAPTASSAWQFTPGVPAPAPSPSTQPITLGR